jgi:predicted lipid-binding transport protein (Tim44 family)
MGFMFEVVLFAAIAAVVCVAFYSVLGKSVGQGPDDAFNPDEVFGSNDGGKSADERAAFAEEAAQKAEMTGLAAIAQADPSFSPARFIDGAKTAYSMILEAYASGDRDMLESLLTPDVYAVYDAAITDREAKDLTQITDLGRLKTAQIVSGQIEGREAIIRVLYEAEIASALRDASGELVEGDPDMLASISEHWTFVRDVKSDDPTWRLAEVEPSEGDDLAADPTPDTTP